ncbi:MAG TPA: hypothetical protein VJZ00_05270 [Thermoanaerobaculia bacterium]|nr:hypothetical protein [Thermoanaerobaculia bacterium]
MPSTKPVEPLDTFETDVPVTPADVEALRHARTLNDMSPHEYLQFLLTFTKDLPAERHIIDAEPFEL